MKVAKSRHRIMAFLFDVVIVYSISLLILAKSLIVMIRALNSSSNANIFKLFVDSFLSGGVVLVFFCLYYVMIPYLLKGQTLGKKFFGIKIVKTDGSDVDFGTLFIREIVGKILVDIVCFGTSLIASGFVLINSENHLTFHDILTSTMVIDVD